MVDDEPSSKVEAAHDVVNALRAEGHTVGFQSEDIVEDFDSHAEQAKATLDADDLAGFFVVAHRSGHTDFASSVVLGDSVAWGLVQIEMLGAHFRSVHDQLPLDTTELIEAMMDEAIAVEEMDDE